MKVIISVTMTITGQVVMDTETKEGELKQSRLIRNSYMNPVGENESLSIVTDDQASRMSQAACVAVFNAQALELAREVQTGNLAAEVSRDIAGPVDDDSSKGGLN